MSDAFEKITELKRQLQRTIQEEGGKILQAELKKTLDLMPEVEAIVWTQNHDVYNDETYEFKSSGFGVIPTKDCPWRAEFIKELDEVYGENDGEAILNKASVYAEIDWCLRALAKRLPDHADRINFIQKTVYELSCFVPQEVLETFGDEAARATREGLTFEEYSYGY